MSALHPTPTRVALLQDIADGSVHRWYHYGKRAYQIQVDRGLGEGQRYVSVKAQVDALEKAGWTRVGPIDQFYRIRSAERYELTQAGIDVLVANGGTP